MRVHVYTGGLKLVEKSGVGQAVRHQEAMLARAGVEVTESWRGRADAVHINTVLPDSAAAALRARRRGERVIWYGHSTEADFRDSFVGSNRLAPLFSRWLRFCYGLGDAVITPTPYSRRLLADMGLRRPIYVLSNGVDTDFFAPGEARGAVFRRAYGLTAQDRVVVSAGHYMARKGLPEFIGMARALPQARFFWFGYTEPALVPPEIRAAMADAPANLCFPGFVTQAALRDAYCGADLFAFCSREETEGIVVLEALACGVPALVRDIPVYAGWLENGVSIYKAAGTAELVRIADGILSHTLPDLTGAGRAVAASRSLEATGRQLCAIYRALSAGDAASARRPGWGYSYTLP